MHRLDREIRRASGEQRSLDDAVRLLAHDGGQVTTASFLRAVNRTAGRDLTALFTRHVTRGEAPPTDE